MVSDELQLFLIQSGIGVMTLVLLLILQISLMRFASFLRQRTRDRVLTLWRPILVKQALGEVQTLPLIKRKDWRYIAEEWNRLIGSLRGEARNNLIQLAWNIKLDRYVKKLMFGKGNKNKLFAIVTLGHMRAAIIWNDLIQIMNKSRTTISLVSAQALIQIDAARALKQISPLLGERSDWHWAGIAHIFRQSDRDTICPIIEQLINTTPEPRLPGLIRLIDTLDCDTSSKIIGDILNQSKDERVISTCLHIVNDPYAVQQIRHQLKSQRSHVRMHAATALGRLGLKEDIPRLVECLQDSEWWVRYRAAQALAAMPFVSIEMLEDIHHSQQDRYARGILQQVISERQYYAS